MKPNAEFKHSIYKECIKVLGDRIKNAKDAMEAAQEAANGEEKSSAGDKYETSRAMGHRDREMYARQMVEAQNELNKIERLNLDPLNSIKLGSLLHTQNGLYFIMTGIGKLEIDGTSVMVISRESPIAAVMMGKAVNNEFTWQGTKIKILEIL